MNIIGDAADGKLGVRQRFRDEQVHPRSMPIARTPLRLTTSSKRAHGSEQSRQHHEVDSVRIYVR